MTTLPATSGFIELLRVRAARRPRRIAFPETADLRVREAIAVLARAHQLADELATALRFYDEKHPCHARLEAHKRYVREMGFQST